jgi:hypothetical protein
VREHADDERVEPELEHREADSPAHVRGAGHALLQPEEEREGGSHWRNRTIKRQRPGPRRPPSQLGEYDVIAPFVTSAPVSLMMCVIEPAASETVTIWCIDTPAPVGVSIAFSAMTAFVKTL